MFLMYIDDNLIVAGWGRTGEGQGAAQVLMKAAVSVPPLIQCSRANGGATFDKVICASGRRNGTCAVIHGFLKHNSRIYVVNFMPIILFYVGGLGWTFVQSGRLPSGPQFLGK